MISEEKKYLWKIYDDEKNKLSSLIHSLTEAKLIYWTDFSPLQIEDVYFDLYKMSYEKCTPCLKLLNQYQTYNFSASFKSCCPSCNFLSCRAAILVLFYFVTPLCTDDLVTGHLTHLVGTRSCTMVC